VALKSQKAPLQQSATMNATTKREWPIRKGKLVEKFGKEMQNKAMRV